jgi:hypothetical protein
MNDLIKEFARQAGFKVNWQHEDVQAIKMAQYKEFAELIVRECVDIVKHNIYEPDYRGGSQILKSFENYQANRRAEDILNQIKEHFGVEE